MLTFCRFVSQRKIEVQKRDVLLKVKGKNTPAFNNLPTCRLLGVRFFIGPPS